MFTSQYRLRTWLRGLAAGLLCLALSAPALADRIKDLAAQVVSLTAQIEGPGSEINKLLASGAETGPKGASSSLAERIRALQKRAAEEAAG